MDNDENLEDVKSFVTQNGMTWTQTRTDSIKEVLERFGIEADGYPTHLLLDPQGKVLSVGEGELALGGSRLLATLDKLLPSSESRIQHVGHLEPTLTFSSLDMKHFFAFGAATPEDVKKLPIPLKEGEKAFITGSNNSVRVLYGVSFAVVEPADNARPWVLYADLDRDGAFTPAERFVFSKTDYPRLMTRSEEYREKHKLFDRGSAVQNVLVHIPLPAGSFFRSYPLKIWVDPDYAKARGGGGWKVVWRNTRANVV